MNCSRRDWILGTLGSAAWASIAAAQDHAHRAASASAATKFEYFDAATAADIAALASQILPSDDGPGATEAGVVYFIDRALKTFDSDKTELYRKGVADLREASRKMFPESKGIAELSSDQQVQLMRAIEKSEFFEALRIHTLLGFLGSPSYGGNRDKAGWTYIGFEDRMSWKPPFGQYDAEAK